MSLLAFLRRGFGGRTRLQGIVVAPPVLTYTAPTAPSALTVTSVTTNSIAFSWTASAPTDAYLPIAGYKVYRGATLIANIPGLSVTASGLSPSTNYSFTVVGYTTQKDSAASTPLSQNTAQDATPDDYTFTAQTGVAQSTLTTSNAPTITGISGFVPVSVSGGEWAKNGASWRTTPGIIASGQTVSVRHTSHVNAGQSVSTTLQVGTLVRVFTSTTAVADVEPDAFSFLLKDEQPLATTITSDPATITGISQSVLVSVSGPGNPQHNINGAGWSSVNATISNGQTLQVRHTSAAVNNTSVDTTVYVGQLSAVFTSVTLISGGTDYTPDPIADQWVPNLPVGTQYEFASFVVAGIDATADIAIIGGGSPQYKIGVGGTWTNAAVTNGVALGNTVYVRMTNSPLHSDGRTAQLTIGTAKVSYTVSTEPAVPPDTNPDVFSFTQQNGVATSSTITSNQITIAGINTTVNVTVTLGTYSLRGEAYTSSAGVASVGNTLQLRHTSSGSASTAVNQQVTVGDFVTTFTSVTAGAGPDITPNPFGGEVISNVAPGTVQPFSQFQITGIDSTAAISISGAGTPEYQIGTGAFTSGAGTVNLNDLITVHMTAGPNFNDTVNCTLFVGNGQGSFQLITMPADTTPADYSFAAQTGVAVGSTRTSAPAQITGINSPAPITVSGDGNSLYKIGTGGAYVNTAGSVPSSPLPQFVYARHTAASTPNTAYTTTINIGGVVRTFTSTTAPDTTAPSPPILTDVTAPSNSSFTLTWSTASDNVAVTGYAAYYGSEIEIYNGPNRTVTETGIAPSTSRTYYVRAYDAAGNISVPSNSIPVSTPADTANNRTIAGTVPMGGFIVAGTVTGGYASAFQITSVSAPTVAHGQTITVTGNGFGTGGDSPLLWDDMETGTLGSALAASPRVGSWAPGGGDGYSGTYSNTRSYSGTQSFHSQRGPYGFHDFASFEVPFTGLNPDKMYQEFAYYVTAADQINGQQKVFFHIGNTGGTNNFAPAIYWGWTGWWVGELSIESNQVANQQSAPPLPQPEYGAWHIARLRGKQSNPGGTANGSVEIWIDNTKVYSLVNGVTRNNSANSWKTFAFFHGSTNNPGVTDVWVDDAYLNDSWAILELCNSSTYSAATKRKVQPASTWANTSIVARVNTGGFTSGSTAYLFVTDANGIVSSGFPINIA